ncbi:MAG: DUF4410 domain-containing protein [Gammaproteobacteria bacterium]|nr:DUF4410 domain-containing protein [Gammaproteobacteria bacterium]
MSMHRTNYLWKAGLCLVFIAALAACGTVRHEAQLESGYVPPALARVELGDVSNATGNSYDIDIETMLADALMERLAKENLLATTSDSEPLTLRVEIVEYAKGSATLRWLAPGAGKTVLEVRCELLDGEKIIGSADARRSVAWGGAYSAGAWKSIFRDVADDVVKDVATRLQPQGA